jgi:hypothetical protein
MSGESARSGNLRWLLQPPAAGEIHLHVAVGEGAELTPQLRAALEDLISTLQQADVQGFASSCSPQCPMLKDCGTMICNGYHNCGTLINFPCLADVTCKITSVAY